ncbi:MAG: flagellar hook assembly protein FlgD [Alphaproteobacteria bacterium]
MSINALGAASATSSGSGDVALKSLANNFDTFLQLLTTQLQNQDPLSPMDSTEFTNQLVLFSQLEQQINQSKKLEQLVGVLQTGQTTAALGLIGEEVEAQVDAAVLADGEATIAYDMPPGVANAAMIIVNERGMPVRALALPATPGRGEITWDGKNENGIAQADGTYSVVVNALDSNDERVAAPVTVFMRGVAREVVSENGLTYLTVGDRQVLLDNVVAIRASADPQ